MKPCKPIKVFRYSASLLLAVLLPILIFAQTNEFQQKQTTAIELYKQKKYHQATVFFEELYKEKKANYLYNYLFNCYLNTDELKKAEKLSKKSFRATQQSTFAIDLGYVNELQGDSAGAKKNYDEVINNLPDDLNKLRSIANIFISRGKNEYASRVYMYANQNFGESHNMHMDMAMMHYRNGAYDLMFEEYLNHLLYFPEQKETVKNRISSLLRFDVDDNLYELLREKTLLQIQAYPENKVFADMLLWLALQTKDYELAIIQAKAYDVRFGEGEGDVMTIADISFSNHEWAVAEEGYAYLMNKGEGSIFYVPAYAAWLRTRLNRATTTAVPDQKIMEQLESDYGKALEKLGLYPETSGILKNRAHILAFYLNRLDEAREMLESGLGIQGLKPEQAGELKLELGDVYLFDNEVWEATLLYSQVDKMMKNDLLGHQAKLKNAKLQYYIGEFEWAQIQLDVLKSATSKLISNDAMELSLLIHDNLFMDSSGMTLRLFAEADLLYYRKKPREALVLLDSLESLPNNEEIMDDVLFRKAHIHIDLKETELALSCLKRVTDEYPDGLLADNALFMEGDIYQYILKDHTKALEAYQRLIREYPFSMFVVEARKQFRMLRGDPS